MDLTIDSGIAAIGAAVVVGLISLFATIISNNHQTKMQQIDELRQLRDRKLDRMRVSAKPLFGLVVAMNEIMVEQNMLHEGESKEQRDARHNELWRAHAAKANEALIELSLDTNADKIIEAYHRARSSFQRYQTGRAGHLADHASTPWPRDDENAFKGHLGDLEKTIRETLSHLESPVNRD